jgi:hypothetical protein
MTVASISQDVSTFLADVRTELADLSPEERDDLMAEVEASVIESASDSPIPIAELNLGADYGDPNRRILVTRGGGRIFNSFPIRYFEPGTTHVSHRNAGPMVRPPVIKTQSHGSARVAPQYTTSTTGR